MAAAPAASVSAPARLRGFSCHRSVSPIGRGIAVSAVMRPVKGTRHLAVRFDLLSRTTGAAGWVAVPGGDLGTWVTPRNATLGQRTGDVWILTKSVNELHAPAAYRFRVTFRWSGARGQTLATAVRQSATCNQPELRPDLLVQTIDVQPIDGHPRLNLYVATIANGGATAARNFRVQFAPGNGEPSKYRTIRVLGPHASTTVKFEGPACLGSAPKTVTVDPDGVVDDFNRANNTLGAGCSSASGHA